MGTLSADLVLFSDVRGIVLCHGKPVHGAALLQEIVWSDNPSDVRPTQTTSAVDGRFFFPTVERVAGLARWVPHQPVILQKITIRHEGIDYLAWRHTRNSYAANAELAGRPLELECELAREPGFEGTHYGIGKVILSAT